MDSRQDTDRDAPGIDSRGTVRARLSKDDAFHLLQNTRRRAVLRYILQRDEDRFVMRDVAEAIAAWEHDTTVDQLDSDERQRVYISLYQSHLPKLDDADVIDYDQDRGVIEPRLALHLFEPYLEPQLDADAALTLDAQADADERSGLAAVFALLTQ